MKFRIVYFSHLFVGCAYLVALTFIILIQAFQGFAQPATETVKLNNPFSIEYIETHLRKSSPRLILNSEIEHQLEKKLDADPVIRNMYEAIKRNATQILKQPLLERIATGRRLLGVSREMLYRANMLGMTYRIEKDPDILARLNDELMAVCNFSDWNPSHFLDVAEMALAVAFAMDWTGEDLPEPTVRLAKTALIKKAIEPSFADNGNNWWINSNNNWNQVCHAGMIAVAIVLAEEHPDLSAKTIHRALDNMHFALEEYGPDGVYPEGSTYWGYGTNFTVLTAAMFESAFGTDFGLAAYPGFLESAVFGFYAMLLPACTTTLPIAETVEGLRVI